MTCVRISWRGFSSYSLVRRAALPTFWLENDLARRAITLVAAGLISVTCVLAQKLPQAPQGPSVAARISTPGPANQYVGNDRCRSCHRPEFLEFGETPHAKVQVKGVAMTCETCHGPGKAHSNAEEAAHGNPEKEAAANKLIFGFHVSPKENAERCLACHLTSKQQDFFAHSAHQYAGISCNQCHAMHLVAAITQPTQVEFVSAQREFFSVPALPVQNRWLHNSLLKESESALCYTCHRTVEAQFALPFHHRVPEGLMKCTDCHNPHGTMNHFMLAQTHWETCVRCHVEERGPFLYEHPAVRVSGCVACHNPHGSVNNFLMVRREIRFVCLQCHTGFHGQAGVPHGRLRFQTSGACTRCHIAVHGSNFDETLLR